MKGAVALIINSDSTLLASSSPDIRTGEKSLSYNWFRDSISNALQHDYALSNYQLNGQDKMLFSKRITIGDKEQFYLLGLNESVTFAALTKARNTAIVITLIATLISVLIAFYVIQVLYRPVISLRDTVKDLSSGNGDLTQRLAVTTNDDIGQISSDVQAMSEQAKSISSILGVIGEVAEQTNLLALNAAIEAARAGDQGRGFAVVADEVRELANRTTASTRKIEEAISDIVVTLNHYGDKALEGAENINEVNTRLVSIVNRFKI